MSASHNKGKGAGVKFIREHAGDLHDDCVPWPFSIQPNGYGFLSFEGRSFYSHRFMCALAHGLPPTPKHHAAHSCHNRACINPRHLSWKTLSENMLDRRDNGTANNPWWGKDGKLTVEQAAEILALKGADTQARIAARFGITESNVRKIQTGKTWGPRIAALLAHD